MLPFQTGNGIDFGDLAHKGKEVLVVSSDQQEELLQEAGGYLQSKSQCN